MGYSGFMINLDEAINLYKISTSAAREKTTRKFYLFIMIVFREKFQIC